MTKANHAIAVTIATERLDEMRKQVAASQLRAAQAAVNAAWNLLPLDTPRLVRERCKQIDGDLTDVLDDLARLSGEQVGGES